MRRMLSAAVAIGAMLAAASPALARQGCGVGGHRGPYGHCRPNRGPYVRPGVPVVGVFYTGRGWWDGHRYWQHRDRWHGRWRYR